MPKSETPKKLPRISVLERRTQNPFGEPSSEIRFKEPNITARWFNDTAHGAGGQIHRAKELGWVPVTAEMVEDVESIGSHTVQIGQITRGERGQEVLMWMPTDTYQAIQWAKTRVNLEKMHDFDKSKQEVLNAAARQLGGEAADYLQNRVRPVGQVTTQYERVERDVE